MNFWEFIRIASKRSLHCQFCPGNDIVFFNVLYFIYSKPFLAIYVCQFFFRGAKFYKRRKKGEIV